MREETAPPHVAAPPRGRSAPRHPHPAGLDAIVSALSAARHPVLLAGLEASRALDAGALAALAERLGAPVLTTYKAKGVLDERHPLWAGIVTGGALEAPLLEAADAILTVGLDPVELLTKPWPYAAPLALRACDAGAGYGAPKAVWVGDLALAVAWLAERLPQRPATDVRAHREGALAALRIASDSPLTAWRIVEVLGEELPADTVAAVDAGAHMFAATWFWRAVQPRRFLISNGLATMGFAVPAAVAAAREGFAVAITGDGGMAYGAFELETAVRLGARVLVVVVDDASLSLIRIKHEARGHDRSSLDFGAVGFAAVAAGLGVASWEAERRGVPAARDPQCARDGRPGADRRSPERGGVRPDARGRARLSEPARGAGRDQGGQQRQGVARHRARDQVKEREGDQHGEHRPVARPQQARDGEDDQQRVPEPQRRRRASGLHRATVRATAAGPSSPPSRRTRRAAHAGRSSGCEAPGGAARRRGRGRLRGPPRRRARARREGPSRAARAARERTGPSRP